LVGSSPALHVAQLPVSPPDGGPGHTSVVPEEDEVLVEDEVLLPVVPGAPPAPPPEDELLLVEDEALLAVEVAPGAPPAPPPPPEDEVLLTAVLPLVLVAAVLTVVPPPSPGDPPPPPPLTSRLQPAPTAQDRTMTRAPAGASKLLERRIMKLSGGGMASRHHSVAWRWIVVQRVATSPGAAFKNATSSPGGGWWA
jgi:hypothetical protein